MNRLAAMLGSHAFRAGLSTPLLSTLLMVVSAHTAGAASHTFTALTATMTTPRAGHTATRLPNGQVLLIGGDNLFPSTGTTYNTAERYDPMAHTFAALTATMTTARENYTATLLCNGQVLLTGGFNDQSDCLDTAEMYDPVADTFTALSATMTAFRCDHAATLLPNCLVFIAGGSGGSSNTAEVYDPTANTFTALTATMTSGRAGHRATLLLAGQVLLTGGFDDSGNALNTAEVYDPAADAFSPLTATMTSARVAHTTTLLPDGQVLIAGGAQGRKSIDSVTILNTAEVYDPVDSTFTALSATMTSARCYQTATLLPNGQVLLAGGIETTSSAALNTAELYTSSVLSTPITATATCIPVSDTSVFSPAGGFALIDSELISYVGVGTSCSGASGATAGAGTRAAAMVLTGVRRNFNGRGGAHAAATPVSPAAAPSAYVGDCDASGVVTVDEIITLARIALGAAHASECPSGLPATATDADVTVAVIMQAVNKALIGLGNPG